jgi:integrase
MSRFILRTGRPRKDGKVTLTFNGYVHGHRIFCGTGLAVKPADWDDFRQQVRRNDPNYAHINARLRDIQARFDHEIATLVVVDTATIERLRREFSRKGEDIASEPVEVELTFWSGYDAFIQSKATDRGERTIAKYKTLRTILHEFEGGFGRLTFQSMTLDFYDAFKRFLIKKRGLTNNTIGKYVSTLKTYLSWAEDRGVAVLKDYRKFKVDEEDVEVVALTMDEVNRLEGLGLSEHPRLDRVRDLFLFACYTGARFGDVQKLHMDDIRGAAWFLRMGKTRSETRIPLIPQAVAILKKYNKDGRMPKISSQRMNDYLKELGQLAEITEPVRIVRYQGAKRVEDRGPKWQFLSSHVARKTFVTISLERGMRPEVVMSVTGHSSFKTMKKYIALTDQARREEITKVWG